MAETEQQLVERAQNAVSRCNWEVGECAARWTERYARGRTDADFAAMVGLSADQVFQRRRVAEVFGETYGQYAELKWSHFYTSLNWEDAGECLQWADENQATVSEMKAWRRAIRGEDAALDPAPTDDFAGDPAILHVSGERTEVKDVDGDKIPGISKIPGIAGDRERAETLAGVARNQNGDDEYAPFRSDAGSPPPSDSDESGNLKTVTMKPSALRVIKRATGALNRVNEALTDDVLDDFATLPKDVRERFTNAVAQLSSTAAALM